MSFLERAAESAIDTFVSGVTLALAINAITSTHASTDTFASTDSATPSSGIRAVNVTTVARNLHRSLGSTDSSFGADFDIQLISMTDELEAETGGSRSSSTSGQSTSEALRVLSSTIGFSGRKSSVVGSSRIITIVGSLRRMIPFAATS